MINLNNKEKVRRLLNKAYFKPKKELYRCYVYQSDKLRDIIFLGEYEGREVCFKIYNDLYVDQTELVNEAEHIRSFNRQNESKILKAPKVLKSYNFDGNIGWFITEYILGKRIIKPGNNFSSPEQKKEICRIFIEYKRNFKKAWRAKTETEKMSAVALTEKRVSKWFRLSEKEGFLKEGDIVKRLSKALNIIDKRFNNMELQWSHGHFCNREIIKRGDEYYLTDFAHVCYKPELYELPFILWSLSLENEMKKLTIKKWIEEIEKWRKVFEETVINNLSYSKSRFNLVFDLNMLERCLGAILADIGSSDRPKKEKERMLKVYYPLFDHYLDKLS